MSIWILNKRAANYLRVLIFGILLSFAEIAHAKIIMSPMVSVSSGCGFCGIHVLMHAILVQLDLTIIIIARQKV